MQRLNAFNNSQTAVPTEKPKKPQSLFKPPLQFFSSQDWVRHSSKVFTHTNFDLVQHLMAKQDAKRDMGFHPIYYSDEMPKHFWEKWLGGRKKESGEEVEASTNGEDDWWGLRRPGMKHEHKHDHGYSNDDPIEESDDDSDQSGDDDHDDHGGEMMPIPGF